MAPEQDGTTVTPGVSEGAPAQTAPAVDPTDERFRAIVDEALSKERGDIARRIQSETDKRVEPLKRRLADAERRNQHLEGTLAALPTTLGDIDPEVRSRVENQALKSKVSFYESQDQAAMAVQREQEAKEEALRVMREEIAELGLDPSDSRISYDLDQPNPLAFRRKALSSARAALREDNARDQEARLLKVASDLEAKLRKATGVDSQDAGGGSASAKTFKRSQIKDRAFYKANQEEIEKAYKEGRIED